MSEETRRGVAAMLRTDRWGNSKSPRWGKVKLRYNGNMKDKIAVLVLTVPSAISKSLADEFENQQLYTCHIDDAKRIIFTPAVEE